MDEDTLTLTYDETTVEFSPHDICLALWIPLDCDGVPLDPLKIVPQCGLTEVRTIREVTSETVDEDPSGQAGVNCAYRRVPGKTTGWVGEADVCSKINPLIGAMLNRTSPVIDPSPAADGYELVGVEDDAGAEESGCPSCGRKLAICKHSVALITVHNAWCGKDRHPTRPFAFMTHKSVKVEPIGETFAYGRGFPTSSYRWALQRNEAFIDPFGIDPRGEGNKARWSMIAPHVDAVEANDALLDALDGCDCGACEAPTAD